MNDPAPIPEPHPSEGSYHWSFERFVLPSAYYNIDTTPSDSLRHAQRKTPTNIYLRLVCVGLVPLTFAPFAAGSLNPVMDAILCSLIVAHSHIGFQ